MLVSLQKVAVNRRPQPDTIAQPLYELQSESPLRSPLSLWKCEVFMILCRLVVEQPPPVYGKLSVLITCHLWIGLAFPLCRWIVGCMSTNIGLLLHCSMATRSSAKWGGSEGFSDYVPYRCRSYYVLRFIVMFVWCCIYVLSENDVMIIFIFCLSYFSCLAYFCYIKVMKCLPLC